MIKTLLFAAYAFAAANPTLFDSVIVNSLTPNTAMVASSGGLLSSSPTTSLELSYVHGVTSSIQTQLNGTQPTIASYTAPTHQFINSYAAGAFGAAQPTFSDLSGNIAGTQISATTITNAMLVHPSTTVNGQTCTLGSSCTVTDGTAVDSVSVATANGLAGTSSGGQNPILTLSTTVTGITKGNGTALSAAVANTDYLPATTGTAIQKASGGGLTAAVAGTDYQAPISSTTPVSHQFLTAWTAPNTFSQAQPAFSDISGSLPLTQLASQAADTFVANGTGSAAVPTAISAATAASILPAFVGDTGSGGTQGLVLAPPAGSRAADDFLSANGSFAYVDQSKPLPNTFSFLSATPVGVTAAKVNNVITYTAANGIQYAATMGTASATPTIFDISNQNAPVQTANMATLQGAYNAAYANISGVDYIIVASSGGFNLYIVNVSNPYAPTITTTFAMGATQGSTYNVAYAPGYAYLATQNSGLKVVDIGGGGCAGTLLAPVVCYTQGSAKSFGVAVNGTTLYTTQYSTSPYATRLLNSWNITSPAAPTLNQALTLPGLGETLGVSINSATNTAFVSDNTGVQQLDIVDITNPSAMTNLSQISMPSGYSLSASMKAIPVGNYVFMPIGSNATTGGAIEMIDVSNRASPFVVSTVVNGNAAAPFGGISLDPRGGYLWAGDYGIAPGNNSMLDAFSMPQLGFVAGGATIDALNAQGSVTIANAPTVTAFGTAGVVHNSAAGLLSSSAVSLTADVTGLLPNANLANTGTTINGTLCTLGSTCTVAGSGAVTAVSVTSANGLAGTSSGGTTPALTLSTTVTGALKGNGTAISAITNIAGETPSGTINNSNTAFTLANTPLTGTVRLYLDGVRTTAYSITGSSITMTIAPNYGQTILADYSY